MRITKSSDITVKLKYRTNIFSIAYESVSDLSPFYVLPLSHALLQNELEKMNVKEGKETDSEQCYFR